MNRLCDLSKWLPILEKHDEKTGFSLPMLKWGFEHVFSHLTREELGAFCIHEIPGFCIDNLTEFMDLDCSIQRRRQIAGQPCCRKLYMVSASTVPSATFQDILLILLLPVEMILRPARNLLGLFYDVWALLNKEAPEFARRLTIVDTGHDEVSNLTWIDQCDAISISGSDDTIKKYERMIDENSVTKPLMIRYGHRVSAMILRQNEISCLHSEDYDHIALDCSVWDQMGCLSPKFLFIESDFEHCIEIGSHIVEGLNRVAQILPGIDPDLSMVAARNLSLRMCGLDGCHVIRGEQRDIVVVHRDLPIDRALMYERTLNIYPVENAIEAAMLLAPIGQGLGGMNIPDDDTRQLLSSCGYNYFCRFGKMQDPPLTWLHNGVGTVKPLMTAN